MAKAMRLDETILAAVPTPPRASQPMPLPVAAPEPEKAEKPVLVPLQIRIPAAEAKAIKRAALEADQTISEFMLACFHASMK